MGKYDKYKKAVAEEIAFEKNQDKLHEKHPEIKKEAVIIEKSNTLKFMLTFLRTFIKTLLGIVSILLIATGIMTLLYPNVRVEFFNVLTQIGDELSTMLG